MSIVISVTGSVQIRAGRFLREIFAYFMEKYFIRCELNGVVANHYLDFDLLQWNTAYRYMNYKRVFFFNVFCINLNIIE